MAEITAESPVRLYAAPRRFDLVTMISVTLSFGLLFALLQLVQFPPLVVCQIAGFITAVGLGQALLFGGKRPRISSVLVGILGTVGIHIGTTVSGDASLLQSPGYLLSTSLPFAIAGSVTGYFAGVVVASVFLVSDLLRKAVRRRKRIQ